MRKTPQRRGTLEVVLIRTFALVRQTRLDQLAAITVEVPDDAGNRWSVRFSRIKPAGKKP